MENMACHGFNGNELIVLDWIFRYRIVSDTRVAGLVHCRRSRIPTPSKGGMAGWLSAPPASQKNRTECMRTCVLTCCCDLWQTTVRRIGSEKVSGGWGTGQTGSGSRASKAAIANTRRRTINNNVHIAKQSTKQQSASLILMNVRLFLSIPEKKTKENRGAFVASSSSPTDRRDLTDLLPQTHNQTQKRKKNNAFVTVGCCPCPPLFRIYLSIRVIVVT